MCVVWGGDAGDTQVILLKRRSLQCGPNCSECPAHVSTPGNAALSNEGEQSRCKKQKNTKNPKHP